MGGNATSVVEPVQRLLLFVTTAIILLSAFTTRAGEVTGKVVDVIDGDTLTILVECAQLEVPVRVAGIDAPEPGMRYGGKARKSISGMVLGREVTVQYSKRDKNNRLIGRVLLNGRDIGLTQIERGLAWHYKAFEGEQTDDDRHAYATAEAASRDCLVGLWRDSKPTPPWDWRDDHPTQLSEAADRTESNQDRNESSQLLTGTHSGGVMLYQGLPVHLGPKGGRFILTPDGKKRYLPRSEHD